MKSIFFISDAHLGFDRIDVETHRIQQLLDFFQYVEKKGKMLIINGDLFDFWFEYRSVIPKKYFNILLSLKRISDQNIEIHYVCGNHDFWMDHFWKDQMGVRIHKKPLEIKLNGKRFYIAHGDGLAKHDIGYRILKKILRHPFNIYLFRLIHPDLGIALARVSSRLSRNHRVLQDKDEEYVAFARSQFDRGFDCVILGHTHRPYRYVENRKIYVNTGDWMDQFSYAELNRDQLTLSYWPQDNSKKW